MDRYALKKDAREALRAARPNAMFMTLIYILLTSGIGVAIGMFVDNPAVRFMQLYQAGLEPAQALVLALSQTGLVALFLTILLVIYNMVMEFGYVRWCLNTSRRDEGELGDLIAGFSMTGRVLLLQLQRVLYYLLWYIGIFLPAIIIAVLAMYIPIAGPVLFVAILLAALVLYASRVLRYSMALFCLADDPESGPGAAIRRSILMMEGNCWNYFLLILSFFGWLLLQVLIILAAEAVLLWILGGAELLAAFAAGNGALVEQIVTAIRGSVAAGVVLNVVRIPLQLWLTPYMCMAEARFFDMLNAAQPMPPSHYRYEQ